MLAARFAHLESLLARANRSGGMYPVFSLASCELPEDELTEMSSRITTSPLADAWTVWKDRARSAADRAFALASLDARHAHVHLMVADLWLRDEDTHAEPFPELRGALNAHDHALASSYGLLLARLREEFDRDSEAYVHRRGFAYCADEASALLTNADDLTCFARACLAWGGSGGFIARVLEAGEITEHGFVHTPQGVRATMTAAALTSLACPALLTSLSLWGKGLVPALDVLERADGLRELEFFASELSGASTEARALVALPIASLVLSFDARMPVTFPWFLPQMKSLRSLTLRYMNGSVDDAAVDLTDMPVDLPELESLSVSGVGKLPSALGRLTHLRTLNVRGWHLEHLPDAIVALESLMALSVSPVYALSVLPEGFERLRSLRTLRVGHLATPKLPRALFSMPWLERVEITSARLWPADEEARLRSALPDAYVSVAFTRNAR